MAERQFTYKLKFEADRNSYEQIKKELTDLEKMATTALNQKGHILSAEGKKDLQDAKKTIHEVGASLTQAFSQELGTTNIAKFNAKLKEMDLKKVYKDFSTMGAAGENAFRQIALKATSVNTELRKTTGFIEKLGDSLANTVRWTITSSMVNSITGSVEKAYGYIKKLDTSLNNIRIVSGQSANQMAEFAVQANKVAQALGTTTTTYTDAALIYYQQGLSSSDVSRRTETTLKMANALGESAQDVSSYMTAIWNNFEDGSKKLEYFGDVITALGATTASSAAEISKGLQQFAAVSQTVGLSYEYATSSLAAVVAATRQSADSVGTAFKTIFSRIQGLKLGETLDDGTTLNKYSNALLAAGVNIKDNNDELKTMDTILEEMAAKWETLNKDEQMALAQTVAGTRQYTYLISLMENWGDVTKNIDTAKNSTGELNKQQEIYNESLRARLNALQSAKDSLTTEFFDADSFKNVIDGLTTIVDLLARVTKSIGGGGVALAALGNIAVNVMSKNIAQGISNVISNFVNWRREIEETKVAMSTVKDIQGIENTDLVESVELNSKIQKLRRIMSEDTYKETQALLEQLELKKSEINLLEEKRKNALDLANKINDGTPVNSIDDIKNREDIQEKLEDIGVTAQEQVEKVKEAQAKIKNIIESPGYNKKEKKIKNNEANNIIKEFNLQKKESIKLTTFLSEEELKRLKDAESKANQSNQNQKIQLENKKKYLEVYLALLEAVAQREKDLSDEVLGNTEDNLEKEKAERDALLQKIKQNAEEAARVQKIQSALQTLSNVGQVVTGFEMLGNTLKNFGKDGGASIGALITSVSILSTSVLALRNNFLDLGVKMAASTKVAWASAAVMTNVYTAGLAIAAVAVVALIAWLVKLANAEDETTKKTRELTEALESAKQTAEDTSSKYKDLGTSLSGLVKEINTLNSLEEKTKEWNEQLVVTNDLIHQLIEDFPELSKAVKFENGQLVLDIDKTNEISKELNENKAFEQRVAATSEIYSLENQKDNIYKNSADRYDNFSGVIEYLKDDLENLHASYNAGKIIEDDIYKGLEDKLKKYSGYLNVNGTGYLASELFDNYKGLADEFLKDIYTAYTKEQPYIETRKQDLENQKKTQYQIIAQSSLNINNDKFNELSGSSQQKLIDKVSNYIEDTYKDITEKVNNDISKYVSDFNKENPDLEINQEEKKLINNETGETVREFANEEEIKQYLTTYNADKEISGYSVDEFNKYYNFLSDAKEKTGVEEISDTLEKALEQYYFGNRSANKIDTSELTTEDYKNLLKILPTNQLDDFKKREDAKLFEKNQNKQLNAKYDLAVSNDAKSLGITESALKTYTKFLQALNEEKNGLKLTDIEAEKAAKTHIEFANALEKTQKNIDSNADALDLYFEGVKTVQSVIAAGQLQTDMSEMFGFEISDEAVTKLGKEFIRAINEADVVAAQEVSRGLGDDAFKQLDKQIKDSDAFENLGKKEQEEVQNALNTINDVIKNFDFDNPKFTDDFIKALNTLETKTEDSAAYINAILKSLGGVVVDTEITTVETPSSKGDLQVGTSGRGDTQVEHSKDTSEKTLIKKIGIGGDFSSSLLDLNKNKSKTKNKNLDLSDDTVDRYHDINVILKRISNQMSLLEKQQSKLFGKNLIENLNKQMSLLEQKMSSTNKKIQIANGEVAELQKKLSSNNNVQFNPDGTIANYMAVMEGQQQALNSFINKYNAEYASASEKRQEQLDKELKAAQEKYNKFKEDIANYDSLVNDTIPSLIEDLEDTFNKEIEINIDKFNMSIKLQLDLSEAEKQWNKFSTRIIKGFKSDNKVGKAEETRDNLKVDYGNFSPLTDQVNGILDAYNKMQNGQANVYGNNKTALLDDLKKYGEELQNTLIEAKDYLEEINNLAVESLEDVAAAADKMNENFESVQSTLEHDIQLVKLISGEDNYDTLLKYYEQQTKIFENQVEMQKSNVDYWTAKMAELEEGGDEWQVASDNWKSAVDSLYSSLETAIEALKNKLATQISSAFQSFEISASGGDTLSYLNTEWDLINKNADRYLDSVNAAYGIQKLENKLLKSIGDTNNVAAQKQLQNIYENELKTLKEMDKVSQYDIDRANKKYELTLKQIALQDAQQNKSKMRLRRDSSGNYSYQFVADDDKLSQLQDEIAEINNSIYNLDKNAYNQNLNEYVNAYQEMQNKITEISTNAALQDEEKERQILLVREQYAEIFKGIIEDNTKYQVNLADSAAIEVERLGSESYNTFQSIADEEGRIIMEELIPQWGTGIQSMISYLNGDEKGGGGLKGAWDTLFSHINSSLENYKKSIEALDSSSGGLLSTIKTGYDNNSSAILALNNNLSKQINLRKEEADAISKVKIAVDSLAASYKKAEESAKNAATAAHEVWNKEQQKAIQETKNTASALPTSTPATQNASSATTSTENTVKPKTWYRVITKDGVQLGSFENESNAANYKENGYRVYDKKGTNYYVQRSYSATGKTQGTNDSKTGNSYTAYEIKSSSGKTKYYMASSEAEALKKAEAEGFDTGGYTGEWGSSGKLAMLHEKELVLNKEDTSNMLDIVNVVRAISDKFKSFTGNFANIFDGLSTTNNTDNSVEQNVYITANFEGATSADEIKNALSNLMNVASQKVHSTRR